MNVKVIATCFRAKEIRLETTFPAHEQDIKHPGEALQMLKNIIDLETKEDPGVPMDLIIVNNDVNFKEGNEYIKSLHEAKTKWGKIIAYTRPNVGWSFGAFNDAFKEYQDDYDFWLFTEDDIYVGGREYYKKLIERFREIEGVKVPIGYLALIGVIKHEYGIHCGGGIGLTSKIVLKRVVEKLGQLPHHSGKNKADISFHQERQNVIREGEVRFTNVIDELGFHLINYGENKSWDLANNLCVPYFRIKNKYDL